MPKIPKLASLDEQPNMQIYKCTRCFVQVWKLAFDNSRRAVWVDYVWQMERENVQRFSLKTWKKRPFGRPRNRTKDDIKIDLIHVWGCGLDSSASRKDPVVHPCNWTSWMHKRWQANLSASVVTIDVSSVPLGNGNVYTALHLLQW